MHVIVAPYAPLAFLACGFAVGAVAICFAEGGSRVPTSGGVYGVIGKLLPRSHAPCVAILCYSTMAIVLALTGTFAELVVLSTLAIAALYAAGCAASWALARRGVALSGTPLNFRFLGSAALIGIGSMLALIALGSRQEIIGLATLIGLSIFLYLIQARVALAKSH